VSLVFLPTGSAVSLVFSPTVSATSLVFSPTFSSPFLIVSPVFFAPCFISCNVPSCPRAASAAAVTKTIIKLVILMISSSSFVTPPTKKTDELPRSRASRPGGRRRSRKLTSTDRLLGVAAKAFIDRCQRRQWDAENVKRCDKSISQCQTYASNCLIATRTYQNSLVAICDATAAIKLAKKFCIFHQRHLRKSANVKEDSSPAEYPVVAASTSNP